MFKKLKDKRGGLKEILTDNLLLIIVVLLILLIVVPGIRHDRELLEHTRNTQIRIQEKIEIN